MERSPAKCEAESHYSPRAKLDLAPGVVKRLEPIDIQTLVERPSVEVILRHHEASSHCGSVSKQRERGPGIAFSGDVVVFRTCFLLDTRQTSQKL